MKSLFTLCAVFMAYLAGAVNVTFQVDMTNQTVSANGVHIAGNFQGWNPSATALSEVGNGIYAVTVDLASGSYQFKYINGNAWGSDESVPAACGTDNGAGGYNRIVEVGDTDTVIDAVCYGECAACAAAPLTIPVTFRVDMSEQTVSANGVHVAGSFQGWSPSATPMSDDDMDGIYEYTTQIQQGIGIQFKFLNGNDWPFEETVPQSCGENNGFGSYNRYLTLSADPYVMLPVCFGACYPCNDEPIPATLTVRVNMSEQTISAEGVHIAGNFQGWDPGATPMIDMGNNIFEYTIETAIGETVQYKFINGNAWGMDESVPAECATDFNRTFAVTEASASLTPVCYGECADCGPIVEPVPATVTVRVNMSEQAISAEGVHIAGNFQGWDPAASAMTDIGNSIYEYTIETLTGETVQYKFINGIAWGSDESVPSECAQAGNRYFYVEEVENLVDTVCFGACDNCGEIVEPTMVMVVFQVDMSNETVSPNGVHVAGNFQGWNPNGTVMDELGGGIYELLYEVEANSTIEFRFINGSEWADSETVPSACGTDDGGGNLNRTLEIGEENVVFGPVCFSGCGDCDEIVEPETVSVTFQVDMTNETVSAEGVHIAGNFQGWNPSSTAMTDLGNGIWSYTAEVDENSSLQFKFINGNDWPFSESVPADCGVGDGFGGYNRSLSVGTEDLTYGPVCFSGCEACGQITPLAVVFQVNLANEIVSPEGVYIVGDFNSWDPTATQMSEFEPGKFQAVVILNSGETTSYKFLNGPDFAGEESVPEACGVPNGFGGFNRTHTALDNETLPIVCFSGCADCTTSTLVSVTFQVDMSEQAVSAEGVHVAGSFNGFSPTASAMTLVSPGVYAFSALVDPNSQVTYKFINGNDWPFAEVVPFECGVDDGFGGYNRSITVDDENVILPEVCFASCVDCPVNVYEMDAAFSLFPNPVREHFTIDLGTLSVDKLIITNSMGQVVRKVAVQGRYRLVVPADDLAPGLYHITDPESGTSLSFVVE